MGQMGARARACVCVCVITEAVAYVMYPRCYEKKPSSTTVVTYTTVSEGYM